MPQGRRQQRNSRVGKYLAVAVLTASLATNAFLATAYYWSLDRPAQQSTKASARAENPERPDIIDATSGLSNLVIAVFTIALFIAASVANSTSADALKASTEANIVSKLAAEAAKTSADAAVAAERAWVTINGKPRSRIERKTINGKTFVQIDTDFDVKNHGKTPATIRWVESRLSAVPLGDRPQPIDSNRENWSMAEVLGAGEVRISEGELDMTAEGTFFSTEEWADLTRYGKDANTLFLVVRIEYQDVFGAIRETGYSYAYEHNAQELLVSMGPPNFMT